MIRLEFALRRKAGMSREEFQQYWREVHGPLVAGYASTLGIHRYVQLHTLDDPVNDALATARGGMEAPYDGVAELWWTSPEDLLIGADDAGRAAGEALLADERNFIDLENSPLWFAYEYPQVNPSEHIVARAASPLVKLFFCLRHPSAQALDDAQLYWRTQHGPLIRGLAEGMRMRRYFQVHYYDNPAAAGLTTARATQTPPYTGHAEAWFDRGDLAALADLPEAVRAMELAIEDESRFIDFRRSTMFIGKEHVFIDRR